MLDKYFKSIVEQDTAAVVVCDNDCKIVYMNPAAVKRYHRDLTGQSLRDCHNAASNVMIDRVLEWFKTITLCIPTETKKRIKTFIWWRCATAKGL